MFHDLDPKKKRRIIFLCIFLISFCVAALIFQFFRLQVLEHEKWAKRARLQHYFTIREPYRRGVLYANTSFLENPSKLIPFTVDVPLYHLYADSLSIPKEDRQEIIDSIMRLLSPTVLEAKNLSVELRRRTHSRRLVSWLTEEQKALFMHWWGPWVKKKKLAANALYFVADFRRIHPMGALLGQVLHTIRSRRDERTGKAYPTGGLELSLNSYLEGTMGLRRLMRSPRNLIETGEIIQAPVHGANVELTIDPVIQSILEDELAKAVRMRQAKGAWGVLVDPWTGYVLALAQFPAFFPDRYQTYFNDPTRIEYTKVKAAIDAYEPGSPTKAITCALALKANKECKKKGEALVFHPFAKTPVSSGAFPGRASKPIKDVTPARYLNLYMATQKSSSIYFAALAGKVVDRMGAKWYRQQLVDCFGLGTKTGVELVGESLGVMPRPNVLTANRKLEWSKATPYSLGMGYNLQVTTLQMARAFSVLATRGKRPNFTLIKRIWKEKEDGTQELIVDHTLASRISAFPQVLDEDIAEEVIRAVKFVTKPGGSAARADIFGYTEAGKTGTAEKVVKGSYSHKAHIASFVGFAPASSPRFVLALVLDEAKPGFVVGFGFNHRGGAAVSPIFREVGRRVLEYMKEPYDDPHGFSQNDPRGKYKEADWVKETEALNALYNAWNK